MLNEVFVLQVFSVMTLIFFLNTYNILTLWYLGGLYLFLLGFWLLTCDGDIFVGFLWVLDLGVGLIFFIFILHYSTFLHQKSFIDKSSRELLFFLLGTFFLLFYYIYFLQPIDTNYIKGFAKTWFFYISWYDYYDFFSSHTVIDLNLLHEIYFFNNSFEFFLINFFLLYGIIASILLIFLTKKVFIIMNYSQFKNYHLLTKLNSIFFIKSQDYIKQQSVRNGLRVWRKSKRKNLW